jgi:uncharacterized RDD family membrane protein YckC
VATATPVVPPTAQAVIGRRIGAAFIDLLLLTAAFVALAAAAGDLTTTNSSFHVGLHGGAAFLYFGIVLGYYFVTEAFLGGQTLGKRLLGIRVVQTDGSRASVGQVAGRTALRVVDAMPILYFVGFVCMLATGTKAQRVGDLAASTFVVDARSK